MAKEKKFTKTWKLGEVCQGGIITIEIVDRSIIVIGKEWDMSAGTRRSSNQSNAKEFRRDIVDCDNSHTENDLFNILSDLATSYHADKIIEWIKSKIKLGVDMGW